MNETDFRNALTLSGFDRAMEKRPNTYFKHYQHEHGELCVCVEFSTFGDYDLSIRVCYWQGHKFILRREYRAFRSALKGIDRTLSAYGLSRN